MKKLLLLFSMMLLPMLTYAYTGEAEINGIKYYIITKGQTAEVRHKNYSGDIIIPSSIEYEGVNCSVVSIGEKAFYNCSELTSITIPNSVSCIEAYAFSGCSRLTAVIIPLKVTKISDYAFQYCQSLTDFLIPNAVTSIGRYAFSGCTGLTSVTIPNSVVSIGGWAFRECTSLAKVIISDLSAWCSISFDTWTSNPLSYAKHLYLGESTEITDLVIPDAITRISSCAFQGCSGITSVTIPNSVTTIGNDSFADCSELNLLTIGSGVTSIGNRAFANCKELSEVYCYSEKIPSTSESFKNSFVEYATLYVPASLIDQYKAKAPWSGFGKIEILDYINGVYYNLNGDEAEVTYLDDNYNSYSGTVVIPESVAYRGKNFSVTRIGNNAFRKCSGLTSITIPNSVSSIGSYAFAYSKKLTSVVIPDGVSSIAEYTFKDCDGLISVSIPNSVETIETGAFDDCGGLTSINLPNSVTTIGNIVFRNCSNLTSVIIPNSVTKINVGTFSSCRSLKTITLPSNLKTISNFAFQNCGSLTDVYCSSEDVPDTHSTAFDDSPVKSAKVHIPNKSIHLYKQSSPWSSFGNFAGLYGSEYTLSYTINGSEYKSYKYWEDEKIFPNDDPTKEGYTFSGWSEIPEAMPAHDVTVTGTFNINRYKLTYMVDGEEYKSIDIEYGATITPETSPTKEGYTFSGWNDIPEAMPAHDVTAMGVFNINSYKLTYTVDGQEYKSIDLEYGTTIIPETSPTKKGYTFSGWNEIPEVMPAHNVTVTGTFRINSYKLIYIVDDEEYKSYEFKFDTRITAEAEPTKVGYTFSGWSEIPENMPDHDVMITGAFTINKYKLIYIVDGAEYKTIEAEYNSTITPEVEPTKEGYTFSGWNEIPETMPANNVTVTGLFTVNTYTLTYMVDGEEYKTSEVDYGSTITPEVVPTKEGYTFSGWDEEPLKMPARDVTVSGTFTINSYKLTYSVDGEDYKTLDIVYNSSIIPESEPTKEGYTFSGWSEIPATMPANNVVVTGTFTVNTYAVTFMYNDKVLKVDSVEYGAVIPLPTSLNSERYSLIEWLDVPETMPAHDITIYASVVDGILTLTDEVDYKIYNERGLRISRLQRGLNIIKYSNGRIRKVIVK
ncbi:leucine-rich repeat protein [uncultured Prevotella sp.]|uniref:leucine-rich repeat protein n=1 Tax=uncultured Prevotella sp. TaxID=159272 RepID=UPI00258D0C6F|nr:leucine-rich repeat protein [uncultured Prevotella sp.]